MTVLETIAVVAAMILVCIVGGMSLSLFVMEPRLFPGKHTRTRRPRKTPQRRPRTAETPPQETEETR